MAHVPKVRRVRLLAAKIETTPGDAIAVIAADAALNIYNPEIQQIAEMEQRQGQGGFNMLPSVVGGRLGKLTFSSHIYGASATPAWAALMLAACGLGNTASQYVADARPPGAASSTQKTLTMAVYQNGRIKKLHGCMGNMSLTLPSGKTAMAEFEFTGIWNAPVDGGILTPTYPTLVPLRVVSSTVTFASWAPKVSEVTLDLGNEVYVREDATTATGYSFAIIPNRLLTGTIDAESSLVATEDVYGNWLSGAEMDLTIVLNNGSDTCTITVSDVQLINPQEADRQGVEIDNIAWQANTDDLKFVFT